MDCCFALDALLFKLLFLRHQYHCLSLVVLPHDVVLVLRDHFFTLLSLRLGRICRHHFLLLQADHRAHSAFFQPGLRFKRKLSFEHHVLLVLHRQSGIQVGFLHLNASARCHNFVNAVHL